MMKVFGVVLVFSCNILMQTFCEDALDEQIILENNCDDEEEIAHAQDDINELYRKFNQRYTGRVGYAGDYPYGITTCQLDPLPPLQKKSFNWIPVAVSSKDYVHSFSCGTCLKFTPRTEVLKRTNVTAGDIIQMYHGTVVDMCKHCRPGEMKLYKKGEGFHDVIYEVTPCSRDANTSLDGLLKMKFSACSNDEKRMKVQMKNMRIPVAQVEVYQDEKWSCLKRAKNNCYMVDDLQNITFPMKGRLTAVDGQILGFTLDGYELKDKNEISLPSQFERFNSGRLGKPPILKCYKNNRRETNESSKKLTGSNLLALVKSIANTNDLHNELKDTTANKPGYIKSESKNNNLNEKESQQGHGSICNGSTPSASNFLGFCNKYLACENGKPIVRSCPEGYLYNSDRMKCEHNNNTKHSCGKNNTPGDIDIGDDEDEDSIYTKRFSFETPCLCL